MSRWPRVMVAASCLSLLILLPISAISAVPEFDRASRLAMTGDYDGAMKEYELFLERAPDDRLSPVAVMAVANLHLASRKDSAGAVPWLDRLMTEYAGSPLAPEAARAKGRCEEAQDRWIDAGETYLKAIALAGGMREAYSDQWVNEVTFAAANSFFAAGDRARQIATYKRVLEGSPAPEVAANSLYRLGEGYERDGDSKSAAEAYARIVTEHPGSPLFSTAMLKKPLIEQHVTLDWQPFVKYAEGAALVQQQDYPGALRNTDELLSAGVNPPLQECLEYRKLTLETAASGDYTEGCGRLREYMGRYPNGQRAALAKRTLEQNWSPIAAQEAVVRENPKDAEALRVLGLTYVQARIGGRAVTVLERSLTIEPDNADAHLYLGYAYSMVDRSDDAAKAFEFYLERNPNDEHALNFIGYSYLGLGQADKAIPYFERYAELVPDDANAHDSLGEGYMEAGRMEEAAREYSKALSLNPSFANSQFMLARVYQEMGEKEKSTAAYRKFLDLTPGGPQADQARAAIESLRNQ